MPRKELSPPDENRKRAERLNGGNAEDPAERSKSPIKGSGSSFTPPDGSPLAESPLRPGSGSPDRQIGSRQASDLEVSPIKGSGSPESAEQMRPSDEKIPESSNRPSAKQYAMSLVAARTYTERGLREKLRIRGYGCDETDEAVEYLKGFGYINDLRIAQNAAEKLAERGNGRRKIFAYLASRGISREVIGEIDLSEYDFKEICLRTAEKLEAKGKRRDQIMRSLSSSGFSSSEITFALEQLS